MSVGLTPLSASICSKPKRFVLDAIKKWIACALKELFRYICLFFFYPNLIFCGIFLLKNSLAVSNSSFTVFYLLKIEKYCSKLEKDFLVRKWGHEFNFFLKFAYQIMCKEKNIFPAFSCFPGRFYCHYYFHYVYLWDYEKPPLRLTFIDAKST